MMLAAPMFVVGPTYQRLPPTFMGLNSRCADDVDGGVWFPTVSRFWIAVRVCWHCWNCLVALQTSYVY